MKTLDGARSFLYTSDVVRYRDTEKAIRTVVTELETLATVWKVS